MTSAIKLNLKVTYLRHEYMHTDKHNGT